MLSELIAKLFTWTTNVLGALGMWGLFVLAVMESFFFPVPVEVLLLILVASSPELWWVLALVAAVGSVIGAMIGYCIGYAGKVVLLERLFPKYVTRIHHLFNKYEYWTIFIVAFTPLPYKVINVAAGAFYIRFLPFVIIGFIARAARFLIFAAVVAWVTLNHAKFSAGLVEMIILLVLLLCIEVYLAKKLWFTSRTA